MTPARILIPSRGIGPERHRGISKDAVSRVTLRMSAYDTKAPSAEHDRMPAFGKRFSDVWCQLSRDVRFLLDQRSLEMQG
jgi:hypothetical protein